MNNKRVSKYGDSQKKKIIDNGFFSPVHPAR